MLIGLDGAVHQSIEEMESVLPYLRAPGVTVLPSAHTLDLASLPRVSRAVSEPVQDEGVCGCEV
jgi:hypothetical protein